MIFRSDLTWDMEPGTKMNGVDVLLVRTPPRWQFWRGPSVTRLMLGEAEALRFYQTIRKFSIRRWDTTEAQEFADDVTRSVIEAQRRFHPDQHLEYGDAWYEFIADLLTQKGYRKE